MIRLSVFLALRQLLHRSRGSIGGLAGVCVAVVLMFMQLGFRNALYDSALNIPAALIYLQDHRITFDETFGNVSGGRTNAGFCQDGYR